MKKRIFTLSYAIFAVVLILSGIHTSCATGSGKNAGHLFPELGYGFDALEPYIDAKTMEIHYTRHHRGYYDKFMDAAKEAGLLETPMEEILAKISGYPAALRNNGGGYYNHVLFWENLAPWKGDIPKKLKSAIEAEFGTWENFKKEFETAAKTQWLGLAFGGR